MQGGQWNGGVERGGLRYEIVIRDEERIGVGGMGAYLRRCSE